MIWWKFVTQVFFTELSHQVFCYILLSSNTCVLCALYWHFLFYMHLVLGWKQAALEMQICSGNKEKRRRCCNSDLSWCNTELIILLNAKCNIFGGFPQPGHYNDCSCLKNWPPQSSMTQYKTKYDKDLISVVETLEQEWTSVWECPTINTVTSLSFSPCVYFSPRRILNFFVQTYIEPKRWKMQNKIGVTTPNPPSNK